MSGQDPTLAIIALCVSVAAVVVSVVSLVVNGRRQHRQWLRDKKVETYTVMMRHVGDLITTLTSINRGVFRRDMRSDYAQVYEFRRVLDATDTQTIGLVFSEDAVRISKRIFACVTDAANAFLGEHANLNDGVWTGLAFGTEVPPNARISENELTRIQHDLRTHKVDLRNQLAKELGIPPREAQALGKDEMAATMRSA